MIEATINNELQESVAYLNFFTKVYCVLCGFRSLTSIYLLIAVLCIVFYPKESQATSFVTPMKFRQVKKKKKKTTSNLVMMLPTRQVVELSAYFDMVYFSIHLATLVW